MRSGGRSDPAAGAGELDCFVAVGGAEFGGCGGEVVADGAGGQGRASGDFVEGGAACGEFQDVGFAGGERAVAGADGVGGEFGVDRSSWIASREASAVRMRFSSSARSTRITARASLV
jgi:hypothetical protein